MGFFSFPLLPKGAQPLTPQNIPYSSCSGSATLVSLNFGWYDPHTNFFQSVKPFFDLHPFLSLDPFEVQVSAGCEVHPGSPSESFFHVAFQGRDALSFQRNSWVPAPDAPHWMETVSKVLNRDQGTRETIQWLFNDICPQLLIGLLEAGQSELEKQGQPGAPSGFFHSRAYIPLSLGRERLRRGWIRHEGVYLFHRY